MFCFVCAAKYISSKAFFKSHDLGETMITFKTQQIRQTGINKAEIKTKENIDYSIQIGHSS